MQDYFICTCVMAMLISLAKENGHVNDTAVILAMMNTCLCISLCRCVWDYVPESDMQYGDETFDNSQMSRTMEEEDLGTAPSTPSHNEPETQSRWYFTHAHTQIF